MKYLARHNQAVMPEYTRKPARFNRVKNVAKLLTAATVGYLVLSTGEPGSRLAEIREPIDETVDGIFGYLTDPDPTLAPECIPVSEDSLPAAVNIAESDRPQLCAAIISEPKTTDGIALDPEILHLEVTAGNPLTVGTAAELLYIDSDSTTRNFSQLSEFNEPIGMIDSLSLSPSGCIAAFDQLVDQIADNQNANNPLQDITGQVGIALYTRNSNGELMSVSERCTR